MASAPDYTWHHVQGEQVRPQDVEWVQTNTREALGRVDDAARALGDRVTDLEVDLAARPEWVTAPITSASPGAAGQLSYDAAANYLYVCVATNTWRRIALGAPF